MCSSMHRLDVICYQKPSLELTVRTKFPVEKSFKETNNKNKKRTRHSKTVRIWQK